MNRRDESFAGAGVKKLFTERHGGTKPRVSETLDETARNGLWALISARIDEEWFGLSFPDKCGDGYAYAGKRLVVFSWLTFVSALKSKSRPQYSASRAAQSRA
jgi:hypothetical protein